MPRRFILPVILTASVFHACFLSSEQVTFYSSYGYRQGADWHIPIRGWVHENRRVRGRLVAELAREKIKCDELDIDNFKSRFRDFPDDSESGQTVAIQFDSDPDRKDYQIGTSDLNGLVEATLELPEATARRLLGAQGSSRGWLTYRAVSRGHRGKGQFRLIEAEGVSVVTDIDDTIKVTNVPGETADVLRNTFCREFVAAPGMADSYKAMGDLPFHYVSGGPWQLYSSLYDFLVSGQGGYPDGSFHFNYFPKNILAGDTRRILVQALAGSLEGTYKHKVGAITRLMERFPGRKFILVGDSGELDPEVYRFVRDQRPRQVQEIWIRDVVNDAMVNPDRLEGMKLIKSEAVICAAPDHYKKISAMLRKLKRPAYNRNRLPPCNQE